MKPGLRIGNGATAARRRHVAYCWEAIRDLTQATALDLADQTGLSLPTIRPILRELESRSLVTAAREQRSAPGRPGVRYTFNPDALRLACLDLSIDQLLFCTVDLGGQVSAVATHPITDEDIAAAGTAAQALILKARKLLQLDSGLAPWDVLVISMPGVVDAASKVVQATALPDWNGKTIRDLFGIPEHTKLIVENHVNAAALAEAKVGAGQGIADQIYLHIARGLKTGIIVKGKLHRGARFAAGEGTHLDRLGWSFDPGAVGSLLEQTTLIETMVQLITKSLADYIGMLDPELVVLGGPGAELGGELLRAELSLALPQHFTALTPPPLVLHSLGKDAAILGAVIAALRASTNLLLEDESVLLPELVKAQSTMQGEL